jgi:predicted HD phosphohydrolase
VSLATLSDVVTTLERSRRSNDGEVLDLLAHGLQCAALLAEHRPDDVELQVAGLVHDLGTVLEPDRPTTHAATGARAVEGLLGPGVAWLVANHDQAKRYLVSTDASYRDRLSEMSVMTFTLQGGEMDASERSAFEAAEHFERVVALRRTDDQAKVPGRAVPGLETGHGALERVAAATR